jgi:hypothetical protein
MRSPSHDCPELVSVGAVGGIAICGIVIVGAGTGAGSDEEVPEPPNIESLTDDAA